MNWTLAQIAQAVAGHLVGNDVACRGVSTDTRHVPEGALFVALKGERFDAHDFLAEALGAGAAAVMVTDAGKVPAGAAAVVVEDTRLALGRLASAWRQTFDLPVLAVTGSNGKTTTKEMIAAILRATFGEAAVLATVGNLNNDIGLPLTLLGLNAKHQAAVVEMGMNHPGEIEYLTRLGQPTVAVVNNAQRAHLAGMGDLDEVAREKGSIFLGLQPKGVAIVNADDAFAGQWVRMAAPHRVVRFGMAVGTDVRGIAHLHGLETQLTILTASGEITCQLALPGLHNARNALAAAAACLAAGIPLDGVQKGLNRFRGVKGRLQQTPGWAGAMVLDDTYNANPDSVKAGIDVLASTIGKKILVLGDMGEIGEASGQYHDEIGGYAKSQGIDRLLALGESAQQAVRNFGEGAKHFCQLEKLVSALKKEMDATTTVLVKGSRFMKMERVVEAIRAEERA